jgi:integrase
MAPAPKMLTTKTPGVYKRGQRYVVVYRDVAGKQRKEAARTYDDARRLKNKREAEVSSGEFSPLHRVTLRKYAEEWVESYPGSRKDGISDRTRADYRRDLNSYAFRFFPARLPLASITTHDVQQFVTWLMDEKKQGQRLTPRTARRILAPLSACYATAKRQGLVRFNPVDGVGVPRRSDEEDTGEERVKVLTRAQLAEFLLALPAEWLLFIEVLAVTGVRWSEAIAWQWKHFDSARPSLSIERSLYNGKPQRPKSRFGRRTIPVNDRVAAALLERRQALVSEPHTAEQLSARRGDPEGGGGSA